MKTPDEIKSGLESCSSDECNGDHVDCPYITSDICISDMTNDALAYINQLEKRLASVGKTCPEWISVKDRLPTESDGTVLVCFPDVFPYNSKEHCVNAKHDQRVKTAKYSQFSNEWYIGDMAGISKVRPTHWMPLPEPPKED